MKPTFAFGFIVLPSFTHAVTRPHENHTIRAADLDKSPIVPLIKGAQPSGYNAENGGVYDGGLGYSPNVNLWLTHARQLPLIWEASS